jgi:N-acetylmuramoyl-L-alanine amidase
LNETKIGTAKVVVDILPKGKVIPNTIIKPTSITIHNTGNIGAPAKNNHNYMKNCNKNGDRIASWHFTVDDQYIYQAVPANKKAWHAGNATGNNSSIGIEICMFNDKARQKKAYDNAIALVKILMKYYGFTTNLVKQHYNWTKKDCPTWLRSGKFGYTWSWFIKSLSSSVSSNKKPSTPTTSTVSSFKIKVVNCTTLNARKGPGTSYAVADTVKVGTILTIVGESGNWYKTKSGLYVSKSYCKKI